MVHNDYACGVRDPDDWIYFDWFDKRMEVAVLGAENTSSRFDVKEWGEGFKVKSRSSASARLPAAMKPGALGKSSLCRPSSARSFRKP